jgi:hypothetical protein
MDNPAKLVTQGTPDKEKQNQNTARYMLDITIPTKNTNNRNKTCVLLQTTGGKEEPRYLYPTVLQDGRKIMHVPSDPDFFICI